MKSTTSRPKAARFTAHSPKTAQAITDKHDLAASEEGAAHAVGARLAKEKREG